MPAVKSAVAPLPVVAAGGVADGRGLAAVLALGADAAWLGTRFVASEEAPFAAEYKQRVVAAAETESIYTTLFDVGWPNAPHRVLHNSTVADWEAAGRPAPGARPAEGEIVATALDGEAIPRYSIEEPTLGMTGDLEALALYAGQSAGLVQGVEPAARIVQRLVVEAETVLQRARRTRADSRASAFLDISSPESPANSPPLPLASSEPRRCRSVFDRCDSDGLLWTRTHIR